MVKIIKIFSILLGLIFISAFNFDKHKHEVTKTIILFFNSNSMYGVGINKQSFWAEKEYHDTVIISDYSYNNVIAKQFKLLKDTVLFGGDDELRYGVAFIRQYNNGFKDTFYSDPSLQYWKNEQGNEYVDTSGFFKRTFRGFFIYD